MISRTSEAQRSKEKLMQTACFRCLDTKKDPGISQADLMKVLGHGKKNDPKVFREIRQS